MIRIISIVAMLCLAATASSQIYKPFYVGSWGVTPEFDYPPRALYSVRGYDDTTPLRDSVRYHLLTPVQLDRARELGLNLIGVTIETAPGPPTNILWQEIPRGSGIMVSRSDRGYQGDFIRRDRNVRAANAVAEICDAAVGASDTLMVSITDYALEDFLRMDHVMFHPEADSDFGNQGNYTLVSEEGFTNIPFNDIKLSTPLLARDVDDNSLRMEPDKGTISGLEEDRKRELSLFRASWNSADRHTYRASGLYILSVIVRRDIDPFTFDPPNTSDVIMNVEIVSRDSTDPSAQRTLIFPLRGERFYHGGPPIRPGPFEVVLGQIEIRETAPAPGVDPFVYIRERDANNPWWTDTTAVGRRKLMPDDDGFDDIDIRITFGGVDCSFLLDAVCLTSPGTFSLFYPLNPDGIAEFAWRRSEAVTRLNSILRDNGARGSIFPNLRFVTGPEQGRHSGVWTSTLLAQALIDSLAGSEAGRVNTYVATAYSEQPAVTGTMSGMFASGHYCYPLRSEYPRPTLNTTDPGEYHFRLNRESIRGFTETARRWRMHASERLQLTQRKPWLPYIQNHSNLYEIDSPPWYDDDPLREPTAAELRQQCNLALAHGADGVMFYHFVSAPWVTSDANLEWPPDTSAWRADTVGGAQALDAAMGTLGFVHGNLAPRY
jgi:hypothetical protein